MGPLRCSVLATGSRAVVRRVINPLTSSPFSSEPCTRLPRSDVQVLHKSLCYALNSAPAKAELSRSIRKKYFNVCFKPNYSCLSNP